MSGIGGVHCGESAMVARVFSWWACVFAQVGDERGEPAPDAIKLNRDALMCRLIRQAERDERV